MDIVVERLDADIFTVNGLFTPEECQHFIERGESTGFEAATVRTSGGPQMMTAIRNNDRAILNDPALAESVWECVRDLVPAEIEGCRATGLFPEFRFYRYDPGQRFKRHKDGSVSTADGSQRSRLSFLIYLNADYQGGETVFSDYEFVDGETITHATTIHPHVGMGLFFIHERKHEGAAVTEGRKYLLRTDVLYEVAPSGRD